ncbi:hypothetical protein SK128_008867 [Halocaridina rubra]|uniref:Ig-like domain-containing protein n=1 Tax=Halocaridina rubra TaxID=373956 RepID=A0AAN8X1L8_HALRR
MPDFTLDNRLHVIFLIIQSQNHISTFINFISASQIDDFEANSSNNSANGTFVVDPTLGRNLQFRVITTSANQVPSSPVLISPNGTIYNGSFDSTVYQWTTIVDFAENGTWEWEVTLSGSTTQSVRVSISAQSKSETTLPIITKASISAIQLANVTPVVITARVTQGNNAVVGAKVRAYVTQPDNTNAPIEMDLLDNGQGADIQIGDGIYSRFFTNFTAKGRYSVKAQVSNEKTHGKVWDDGNSYINNGAGFIASRRQKELFYGSKSLSRMVPLATTLLTEPDLEDIPDYCCGSVVPFDPSTATPTGEFTRTAVAGSFQMLNDPGTSVDFFPPSHVRDLSVSISEDLNQLNLEWTATGDDLDSGTASGYEIRMSNEHAQILEDKFDNSTLLLSFQNSTNMMDILVEAGKPVSLYLDLPESVSEETQYFVALRAIDKANQTSTVSNIAWFSVRQTTEITSMTTPEPTTASTSTVTPPPPNEEWWKPWVKAIIIIGCIVGAAIIIFAITYAVSSCVRACKRRGPEMPKHPDHTVDGTAMRSDGHNYAERAYPGNVNTAYGYYHSEHLVGSRPTINNGQNYSAQSLGATPDKGIVHDHSRQPLGGKPNTGSWHSYLAHPVHTSPDKVNVPNYPE